MTNYQTLENLLTCANKMYKDNEKFLLYYRDYKMQGVWKGNLEVRQLTPENPEYGTMKLRMTKELPIDWATIGNEKTKNDLAEGMLCMLFLSGIDRAIQNPNQPTLN